MRRESGAGPEGTESPDGESEWPRPAFHRLAEDDEEEQARGGLNHLVSRNAAGAQWTWKKVTVEIDSGAAENAMLRSMFFEILTEENGEVQEKDSKYQEKSTSRITGSKSCPSELLRDLYARARGMMQT